MAISAGRTPFPAGTLRSADRNNKKAPSPSSRPSRTGVTLVMVVMVGAYRCGQLRAGMIAPKST
jgi:hypothetical protein